MTMPDKQIQNVGSAISHNHCANNLKMQRKHYTGFCSHDTNLYRQETFTIHISHAHN